MPLSFRPLLVLGLVAVAMIGGSCARSERSADPRADRRAAGTPASPRVVGFGARVPKGGGRYKVGDPYQVDGQWYRPADDPSYNRVGIASYYSTQFHGRRTANGETFDMGALTAAHNTLPMPSYVYVTNLANSRTLLLRVNDRGPFVNNRVIDLSHAAARHLGLESHGLGRVQVRYAGRAPLSGDDTHEQRFLASQPWARGPRTAASWPPAR
jgi:rare lipoprotein A